MALSFNATTAGAGQTIFDFTFPVLAASHVKVSINGNAVTAYTTSLTPAQIVLTTGATAGDVVKVYRLTPGRSAAPDNINLVDFVNGSVLSEEDLDKSNKQLLYLVQESDDTGGGAMPYDSTLAAWNASVGGVAQRIVNLGTPTGSTDAVTKDYSNNASNLTTGSVPVARLPASGVTAAVYGDSTTPLTQVTVDSTGRITAASERAITSSDLPVHTHTAAGVTDFSTVVDGRIDTKIAANALALSGGVWDAESLRVTNVATPILGSDAVNLNALSNLALYGNAAAQLPQSWALTALPTGWVRIGAANGANTIWEQTLNLSPAAVGNDPNLFVVTVGGVLQFPTTGYRIPAPDQIVISHTGAASPGASLSVLVRNFGVSRAITANATTTVPGVVTIGSNINVTGGLISVPTATSGALGVVKPGTGLSVSVDGTLNATVVGDATTAAKGIMQVGVGLEVSSGLVSVAAASNITSATFASAGLKILSPVSGGHKLTLLTSPSLSSSQTLTLTTGGNDRTLDLFGGNLTCNGNSATVSGQNTGDQSITLTGPVTGMWSSGSISTALSNSSVGTAVIADGAVTLAKHANISTNTLIGRSTSAAGAPETISQDLFAKCAGGSAAAFSNPPLLSTASTTFNETNQIVNKGYVDGTSSKAVTGWMKLPNGVLMQWGETAVAGAHGTNYTIAYPTAFTTFFTNTFVVQNNVLSTGTTVQYLHGKTTTLPLQNFIVQSGSINGENYSCTVRWFAIGLA